MQYRYISKIEALKLNDHILDLDVSIVPRLHIKKWNFDPCGTSDLNIAPKKDMVRKTNKDEWRSVMAEKPLLKDKISSFRVQIHSLVSGKFGIGVCRRYLRTKLGDFSGNKKCSWIYGTKESADAEPTAINGDTEEPYGIEFKKNDIIECLYDPTECRIQFITYRNKQIIDHGYIFTNEQQFSIFQMYPVFSLYHKSDSIKII